MKRSLSPTVQTLEDRLALSTTVSTAFATPPVITGVISTMASTTVNPVSNPQLQYLGTVEAPVILALPTGTDATNHCLVIVTSRDFYPYEQYQITAQTTVPYFPQQMSFYSVSQLT